MQGLVPVRKITGYAVYGRYAGRDVARYSGGRFALKSQAFLKAKKKGLRSINYFFYKKKTEN